MNDAGAEVRADLVGDLLRGLYAHVGLDKHVEHVIDELLVDQLPFLLEEVADVGIERLPGLLETLFEFVEYAHGKRRSQKLEVRCRRAWTF